MTGEYRMEEDRPWQQASWYFKQLDGAATE